MTIVLTSPQVIAPGGVVNSDAVAAFMDLASAGIPIGVISNHAEPQWFGGTFPADGVEFVHRQGRQDGSVISDVSVKYGIPSHDFVVLGASNDDLQMAKNGGAVFIAAGWAADRKTATYGIQVGSAQEFIATIRIVSGWHGRWYFEGQEPRYNVRALSNVSGKQVGPAQERFASQIVNTVKRGGPRLNALLVVAARSLLMAGTANQDRLMWGVYPSSTSTNDDREILSEFSHRLRTVVSRVQFAKRGEPLFIRHTSSSKRSYGGGGARTNPAEQIESLHLNPSYRTKITHRNVVILDDCTTYGVSFGVAAALLRAAGAESITCVALGKFGNVLHYYELDVKTDPFAPIRHGQYALGVRRTFAGHQDPTAQAELVELIT